MTREEIKNILRHVFHFYEVNSENCNWTDMNEACGEIFKALEQGPNTGHWIEHEQNAIAHIECSECSSWFLRLHLLRNSYCPNCGARMVAQQESEEKDDEA